MAVKKNLRRNNFIRYVIMIILSFVFLFPILFMIISSFKPSLQLLQDSSSIKAFLPTGDISMRNYIAAFARAPVCRGRLIMTLRHKNIKQNM